MHGAPAHVQGGGAGARRLGLVIARAAAAEQAGRGESQTGSKDGSTHEIP
ncbi:hypothetical protein AZ78_0813 [Lysobacter capsici AZ78]|uniref:Uncharacterized protein n=1 Tax=Lysobacter capsici AZ78 TaxID=1444315 RepID=A0A108U653_9GAMM|nr:hypothetical protein AZ78_0813 [Lysobacter capsici AZ78]